MSFLFVVPAFAADPTPDFSVKTKAFDGSVVLDAGIKADPALAADDLAEGKKWIAQNKIDAEQEYKDDRKSFSNGPWTYERKYAIRSVVGDRYVSILRSDYSNTGGAHPNSDVDTILWDKSSAKRISIRPFFTETADGGPTLTAIAASILGSLKAEKAARGADAGDTDYVKSIQPTLLKLGAVTLAPSTEAGKSSGLAFHYPPYAVGAYAEGSYLAFVPWEKLKPYLTPEGVAIFGGARPKADEGDKGDKGGDAPK
ncbi:hypothetical protein OO17_17680 [Rhodopseudomonas palustris]|uniref:DUF3298 domain-containing protein n=1 Tax=Rhodopseudomonas palustris TaxID=1076 RepID=A0A0D7EI52_RHOPL|nr:hypothetical protein OO17_17680 [Rhodopseudomonas palustris]